MNDTVLQEIPQSLVLDQQLILLHNDNDQILFITPQHKYKILINKYKKSSYKNKYYLLSCILYDYYCQKNNIIPDISMQHIIETYKRIKTEKLEHPSQLLDFTDSCIKTWMLPFLIEEETNSILRQTGDTQSKIYPSIYDKQNNNNNNNNTQSTSSWNINTILLIILIIIVLILLILLINKNYNSTKSNDSK